MTTGVYLGSYPDARFVYTRSYAAILQIVGDTNDVDVSGDFLTMWIDRSIGYGITYELYPFVKPWSSNHYTLDHVVFDCYWHAFFDSVHHPQAYTTNFWWVGAPVRPTISIIQPAAGISTFDIVLPPPPPGYWSPL